MDVEICHRSEVPIVVVAVPLGFVPSFLRVCPQVAAVLLQLPALRARRETFLLLLLVFLSLVPLNKEYKESGIKNQTRLHIFTFRYQPVLKP